MPMCCCAIGCQHSTLNRLFGCVFLIWRHHLRKVNKSSVHTFRRFLATIFLFLTFLNIHVYFIILKTYEQQFTLTTKKSLDIIFKSACHVSVIFPLSLITVNLAVKPLQLWHKIQWKTCHQMASLAFRCYRTRIQFRPGSALDHWGSLWCSPRSRTERGRGNPLPSPFPHSLNAFGISISMPFASRLGALAWLASPLFRCFCRLW